MLTNAKDLHPDSTCPGLPLVFFCMFHILLILLSHLTPNLSIKPGIHLCHLTPWMLVECYPVAGRSLWGDSTPNTHSPTPLFQGCPAMACKAHQCELSHESMYWRLVQWSVLHASRPSKHHHVDPQLTNDTGLSSQPPGKRKNGLHMATSALSLFGVIAMGHRLQCSEETMNVCEHLLTSQSWIVSKSLVLR